MYQLLVLAFTAFINTGSQSSARNDPRTAYCGDTFANWLRSWIDSTIPLFGHSRKATTHRKARSRVKSRHYYRPATKRRSSQIAWKSNRLTIHHIAILAAAAAGIQQQTPTPTNKGNKQPQHSFDSDSREVLVDTGANATMTPFESDFIGQTSNISTTITGSTGVRTTTTRTGLIRWRIEDDSGKIHDIICPAIHNPAMPYRLLSPQQWAQYTGDLHGTEASINGTHCTLTWKGGKCRRTMPLNANNLGTFRTAPGYKAYATFASAHDCDADIHCFSAMYAHSMQAESSLGVTASNPSDTDTQSQAGEPQQGTSGEDNKSQDTYFPFHDEPINDSLPDEYALPNASQELLRWHYRLGHLPFSTLREMATKGELPTRLKDCSIPLCTGCIYGKATKRPWRTKSAPRATPRHQATGPGQVISVDQMKSPTAGFIGQLKGKLTLDRYTTLTVFVDHFSGISFVYCTRSDTAADTLEAKHAFEQWASSFGVKIAHYHADNGRFAETAWVLDCQKQRQTLSFAGVNAHFQNGVAEKRIRDIMDNAQSSLMHAKSRWPAAISVHLWPYFVRHANDSMMTAIRPGTDKTRLELFSNSRVQINLTHHHTCGCPVYILTDDLQTNKHRNKWKYRARVGIYLGMSPKHARTVALVLNPRTGLVSPQFHVYKWDDLFETVRNKVDKTHGLWQQAAGFTREPYEPSQLAAPSSNQSHDNDDEIAHDSGGTSAEVAPEAQQAQPPTATAVSTEPVTTTPPTSTSTPIRRSARGHRPSQRWLDYKHDGHIALPAIAEVLRADVFEPYELDHPLIFAASSDPDTMYYHQAMKQPDRVEFIRAMQKEVDDHCRRGHWIIMLRKDVPVGNKILPSVWSMKRKRRIQTREIYKWKARLNIHGGRMIQGIHYWETYAPASSNLGSHSINTGTIAYLRMGHETN